MMRVRGIVVRGCSIERGKKGSPEEGMKKQGTHTVLPRPTEIV